MRSNCPRTCGACSASHSSQKGHTDSPSLSAMHVATSAPTTLPTHSAFENFPSHSPYENFMLTLKHQGLNLPNIEVHVPANTAGEHRLQACLRVPKHIVSGWPFDVYVRQVALLIIHTIDGGADPKNSFAAASHAHALCCLAELHVYAVRVDHKLGCWRVASGRAPYCCPRCARRLPWPMPPCTRNTTRTRRLFFPSMVFLRARWWHTPAEEHVPSG